MTTPSLPYLRALVERLNTMHAEYSRHGDNSPSLWSEAAAALSSLIEQRDEAMTQPLTPAYLRALVERNKAMLATLEYEGMDESAATCKATIAALEARCEQEYIGWARYQDYNGRRPTTLHLCDSDARGAFRIYAAPRPAVPPCADCTDAQQCAAYERGVVAGQRSRPAVPGGLAEEDRESLARCLLRHSIATGHGDTHADLITTLDEYLSEHKRR